VTDPKAIAIQRRGGRIAAVAIETTKNNRIMDPASM
jgi:hypothetical protein